MLFKVVEKLALELWGCFIVLAYASYLWTGHISWAALVVIALLLFAGVAVLCRVWGKRRVRRAAPIRRAYLDDEGNLHWTEE